MTEMKKMIISKVDYLTISEIANRYSMSVEDFGKLLSKKDESSLRHQIRFSEDELRIIDKEASKLKLTRSKYCRMSYLKVLQDGSYMNLDIKYIKDQSYNVKRDMRVAVSFDNANDYKDMRALARKFSLPFASLMRYLALKNAEEN